MSSEKYSKFKIKMNKDATDLSELSYKTTDPILDKPFNHSQEGISGHNEISNLMSRGQKVVEDIIKGKYTTDSKSVETINIAYLSDLRAQLKKIGYKQKKIENLVEKLESIGSVINSIDENEIEKYLKTINKSISDLSYQREDSLLKDGATIGAEDVEASFGSIDNIYKTENTFILIESINDLVGYTPKMNYLRSLQHNFQTISDYNTNIDSDIRKVIIAINSLITISGERDPANAEHKLIQLDSIFIDKLRRIYDIVPKEQLRRLSNGFEQGFENANIAIYPHSSHFNTHSTFPPEIQYSTESIDRSTGLKIPKYKGTPTLQTDTETLATTDFPARSELTHLSNLSDAIQLPETIEEHKNQLRKLLTLPTEEAIIHVESLSLDTNERKKYLEEHTQPKKRRKTYIKFMQAYLHPYKEAYEDYKELTQEQNSTIDHPKKDKVDIGYIANIINNEQYLTPEAQKSIRELRPQLIQEVHILINTVQNFTDIEIQKNLLQLQKAQRHQYISKLHDITIRARNIKTIAEESANYAKKISDEFRNLGPTGIQEFITLYPEKAKPLIETIENGCKEKINEFKGMVTRQLEHYYTNLIEHTQPILSAIDSISSLNLEENICNYTSKLIKKLYETLHNQNCGHHGQFTQQLTNFHLLHSEMESDQILAQHVSNHIPPFLHYIETHKTYEAAYETVKHLAKNLQSDPENIPEWAKQVQQLIIKDLSNPQTSIDPYLHIQYLLNKDTNNLQFLSDEISELALEADRRYLKAKAFSDKLDDESAGQPIPNIEAQSEEVSKNIKTSYQKIRQYKEKIKTLSKQTIQLSYISDNTTHPEVQQSLTSETPIITMDDDKESLEYLRIDINKAISHLNEFNQD